MKVFSIIHIAGNHCNAPFTLKIDEDVVFHIDRFLERVRFRCFVSLYLEKNMFRSTYHSFPIETTFTAMCIMTKYRYDKIGLNGE